MVSCNRQELNDGTTLISHLLSRCNGGPECVLLSNMFSPLGDPNIEYQEKRQKNTEKRKNQKKIKVATINMNGLAGKVEALLVELSFSYLSFCLSFILGLEFDSAHDIYVGECSPLHKMKKQGVCLRFPFILLRFYTFQQLFKLSSWNLIKVISDDQIQ